MEGRKEGGRRRETGMKGQRFKERLQEVRLVYETSCQSRFDARYWMLVRRCSGQGPHLAMTGEPRGFSRVVAGFSSYDAMALEEGKRSSSVLQAAVSGWEKQRNGYRMG